MHIYKAAFDDGYNDARLTLPQPYHDLRCHAPNAPQH